MHNASTKQRIAALRRRLGIFTGWQPRWVRERRRRLAALAALAASTDGGATETVDAPLARTELVEAPVAGTGLVQAQPETELVPAPRPGAEVAPAPRVERRTPSPPANAGPAPEAGASPRSRRGVRALTAALVLALAVGLLVLGRRAPVADTSAAGPAGASDAERRSDAIVAAEVPPSARGSGGSTVEVRRGDTLWHLAAVHLGDPMRWPELHVANERLVRDPDLIFPGQQLRIPQGSGS